MEYLNSSGPRTVAPTAAMFSIDVGGRPRANAWFFHKNYRATETPRKKREIPWITVASLILQDRTGCHNAEPLNTIPRNQRPRHPARSLEIFDLIPTEESTYRQRRQWRRRKNRDRIAVCGQETTTRQLIQRTAVVLTQSIVTKERGQVGATEPNGRDVATKGRKFPSTPQESRFHRVAARTPRSDQSKLRPQLEAKAPDDPSHSTPIATHRHRADQITPRIGDGITLRLGIDEQFGIEREVRI